MNNLKFKKVFSKAFVVGLAAVAFSATANAQSLSVNEKVETDIKPASVVIGITRFDTDVSLSGPRIVKATANDMNFNIDVLGYEGPTMYYYAGLVGGENLWYELDNENQPHKVTDTAVLKSLNSRDIYYVNNEEKSFTLSYKKDVEAGYELVFDTGRANKTVVYDENAGTLTIPATVRTIEVKKHLIANGSDHSSDSAAIDTFQRVQIGGTDSFEFKNSTTTTGTIAADGAYTEDTNTSVNSAGDVINVTGMIKWTNGKDGGYSNGVNKDSEAGYRVGVSIASPNLMELSALESVKIYEFDSTKDIAKFNKDDNTTYSYSYNWPGISTTFRYTPIVKANETRKLLIVWSSGNTQTFTVNVAGTLQEMPAGTLTADPVYVWDSEAVPAAYTEEVRLTPTVTDGNLITYTGKDIDWSTGHDKSVTVYVTPTGKYAESTYSLSGAKVSLETVQYNDSYDPSISGSEEYKLKTLTAIGSSSTVITKDGQDMLKIVVPFIPDTKAEKGRTVTVTVKWEEGYNQSFKVALADSVDFIYPDITIASNTVEDFDGTNTWRSTVQDKTDKSLFTVNLQGSIDWNTTTGGNTVNFKFNTPEYTAEQLKVMTVKVNGEMVKKLDDKGNVTTEDITLSDLTTSGLTIALDGTKTATPVEVLYNGKVIKTLNFDISEATLVKSGHGDMTIEKDYNPSSTGTDLITTLPDGDNYNMLFSHATGEQVPYSIELKSHYVLVKFENAGTYPKEVNITMDGVTSSALSGGTGIYYIKVKDNTKTSISVKWDDLNVRQFSITAQKNTDFEDASTVMGALSITGASSNYIDQGTDTTTLRFKPHTDSTTYKIPYDARDDRVIDNGVTGYRLPIHIVTPAKLTTAEDIANGYVEITGGKYTTAMRVELSKLSPTVNAGTNITLDLDPIITSDKGNLNILVHWNDIFEETYSVNTSGADFAVVDATLGDFDNDGNAENDVVFNADNVNAYTKASTFKSVPNNSGTSINAYEIPLEFTEGTSKLVSAVIDDARTTTTSTWPFGMLSEATNYKTLATSEASGAVSTAGSIKVYVNSEHPTATVRVRWGATQGTEANKDIIKEYVIDASGILHSISLGDLPGVTYDKSSNEYNVSASPKDVVDIQKYIGKTGGVALDFTETGSGVTPDAETDGKYTVNESATPGKYVVTVVGKVNTTEVTNKITININITPLTAEAVLSADGKSIHVTTTGGGVTSATSKIKVTRTTYNATTDTYGSSKDYVVNNFTGDATVSLDTPVAGEKYKYVVLVDVNGNGSLDASTEKEITLFSPGGEITHTVTYDLNGGKTTGDVSKVVDANGTVGTLTTPTRDSVTIDGKKYHYVFLDWYEVNSTNFDNDGKLKASGIVTASTVFDGKDIVVKDITTIYNPVSGVRAGILNVAHNGSTNNTFETSTNVKKDITVRAVWVRIPDSEIQRTTSSFTVTYRIAAGSYSSGTITVTGDKVVSETVKFGAIGAAANSSLKADDDKKPNKWVIEGTTDVYTPGTSVITKDITVVPATDATWA